MNTLSRFIYITAIAVSVGIGGCTKDLDPESTSIDASRLFSPTGLSAQVVDKTSVSLVWKGVNNATTFTIEVFANGTLDFSGTPVKTVKDVKFEQLPYTVTGFVGETSYSVRVKAVGPEVDDSKWVSATFKTESEQILTAIATADLTSTSVTLRWKAPTDVTHVMLNSVRYDINATEKTAGAKIITSLTPKTNYTATIYNNTTLRGTLSFRTLSDIPTGPNVTVLTATDSLSKLIPLAVPGAIFVLLDGTKYTSENNINIPEGASFTIWGEEGAIKPIVSFNGLTLPATGGSIRFENIDLTGYPDGDATKTKRNYIFNQSTASTTAKIAFENCTVRNFVNTPFRLQGTNAITVDSLIFNKCTSYDIGNNAGTGTYAFIHTNVATGKVNNIKITNSTIYSVGYSLILHNLAPSQSVLIDNCTFDDVIGSTRYFIDYNAQSAGTFTIRNTIIGKTQSSLATARGIRAASLPTVTNSYKTSDAVFSANPITGITDYTSASAALFTDPATGNFRIKDALFAGKSTAGDPKWRP